MAPAQLFVSADTIRSTAKYSANCVIGRGSDDRTPAHIQASALRRARPRSARLTRPFLLKHVLADSAADVPVEGDQSGIDGPRGLVSSGFDQGSDVAVQLVCCGNLLRRP